DGGPREDPFLNSLVYDGNGQVSPGKFGSGTINQSGFATVSFDHIAYLAAAPGKILTLNVNAGAADNVADIFQITVFPGTTTFDVRVNGILATVDRATVQVNIQGSSDDDSLDADFFGGTPAHPIIYDGGPGPGTNTLTIPRGNYQKEAYTPTDPHSGTIKVDGNVVIQYSHLSPIHDSMTVAELTFNATDAADTINVADAPMLDATGTTSC